MHQIAFLMPEIESNMTAFKKTYLYVKKKLKKIKT